MIRVVLGVGKKYHVNMEDVRKKFKMMSVNQMNIYHTLLEAHNVIRNSSSDQIKMKWSNELEKKYSLRSKNFLKVPDKPLQKMYRFFLLWTKTFQCSTSKHKGNL